jgi:hypothetical protein
VSLQLTLANAAFRNAEDKWRYHRRHCPECAQASHRRIPTTCSEGDRLREDFETCKADLAEERRMDKLPVPGQLTLDDVCDGPG